LPLRVITEIKAQGSKWNEGDQAYPFRLLLEFDYRAPMYVYFNRMNECQEIRAYILSLIFKAKGRSISEQSVKFKQAVFEAVSP
jgi:hypothetical protein